MSEITPDKILEQLGEVAIGSVSNAIRRAKNRGNQHVEVAHWLEQAIGVEGADLSLIIRKFRLNEGLLAADVADWVEGLPQRKAGHPEISTTLFEAMKQGWRFGLLESGDQQIRNGHILAAALKNTYLRRHFLTISNEFRKIDREFLFENFSECCPRATESSGMAIIPDAPETTAAPDAPDAPPARRGAGASALERFSQDLTAKARAGEIDPILGRDEEIRKIVDVLMRRRQNNPILTGEAGVGKTAVVEGFALAIAAGDVPPPLRGVTLRALDVGLLQAGASMKGEFEQRLRSVIDEVQASPTPIILFIDEAHTLVGAGGAAGTGDAANLLKPALARGALRTVAATTWSEYRQYFEKDPALARRFQPIQIDEPDAARACIMLRGLIGPMEKHHGVRISDAAIVSAVKLSQRYIPARQLPDKAVSLLDTASARVAISQTTTPGVIADARASLAALESEKAALQADEKIGADCAARIAAIDVELSEGRARLEALEAAHAQEKQLVDETLALQGALADGTSEEARAQLLSRRAALAALDPDSRAILTHVDEQAVAAVVSDWTGVPVGRMVKDEIETILNLTEILEKRVIGQSHGLAMIAKRIETSRAKLDNPGKPIGVFMLCGPSGVGKTETALALAEAVCGGETNIITINMSEFQEAHTVSTLKGAPPGYVGYGEGGRLTEAVRRKPYSVVLLDEIEKAHPDVHELFFQVFDKGQMEDGQGRRVDFKNTLIILTSNVGTDLIMELAPAMRATPEALDTALRAELQRVFPPALLGRIVVVPYFPLSPEILGSIVRLQLDRVVRRVKEAQDAAFVYDDSVVAHIVSLCNDPDSGGRIIDNIVTNTLLPTLSREFLKRAVAQQPLREARVSVENGGFVYAWA